MATYHQWVFECDAPGDEFMRLLQRALVLQGLTLERAKSFDFAVSSWGARAYVKVAHHEKGIETLVKIKAGLFGSAPALADAILDAGRDAQAEITFGREAR